LLVAADVVLAVAPGIPAVAAGVALWGLHMGFTQGLLSALVADTSPPELRGTAFGMFNLLTGIASLAASVIAGALWNEAGPEGTFLGGAAFAVMTLCGLVAIRRYVPDPRQGAGTSARPAYVSPSAPGSNGPDRAGMSTSCSELQHALLDT